MPESGASDDVSNDLGCLARSLPATQGNAAGKGLVLTVTNGSGSGATELAAFDQALVAAGIANFNLLPLSSVIPAGAVIEVGTPFAQPQEWGWRLYVVLAEQRTSLPGEEAWAGIGWMQESTTGRGLFVEHTGTSEGKVMDLIESSLASMRRSRDVTFGPVTTVTRGTTCVDTPVASVVAAVFKAVPW
ncbi:MAG: pyruvoyl-dependent arginine decarboxylase [Actinomycetes bacterium]